VWLNHVMMAAGADIRQQQVGDRNGSTDWMDAHLLNRQKWLA